MVKVSEHAHQINQLSLAFGTGMLKSCHHAARPKFVMGILAPPYGLTSTLQKSAPAEIHSEADRRLRKDTEFHLMLAASLARRSNWTTP